MCSVKSLVRPMPRRTMSRTSKASKTMASCNEEDHIPAHNTHASDGRWSSEIDVKEKARAWWGQCLGCRAQPAGCVLGSWWMERPGGNMALGVHMLDENKGKLVVHAAIMLVGLVLEFLLLARRLSKTHAWDGDLDMRWLAAWSSCDHAIKAFSFWTTFALEDDNHRVSLHWSRTPRFLFTRFLFTPEVSWSYIVFSCIHYHVKLKPSMWIRFPLLFTSAGGDLLSTYASTVSWSSH